MSSQCSSIRVLLRIRRPSRPAATILAFKLWRCKATGRSSSADASPTLADFRAAASRGEWEIIQTAKDGFGDCYPLVWHRRPVNPQLDEEQRQALDALVSNINRVSIFCGGAGTGKSVVLRELVEQIRDGGRKVVVLAPQRQQVVNMERSGFPSPTTVSIFLTKRELAEGAAVIVDEAGQISGRQMLDLLRLMRQHNARPMRILTPR